MQLLDLQILWTKKSKDLKKPNIANAMAGYSKIRHILISKSEFHLIPFSHILIGTLTCW